MDTKELPDFACAETTVYYTTNMLPTQRKVVLSLRYAVKHRHGDKLIAEQTWEVKQSILLTLTIGERRERSAEEVAEVGFLLHSKLGKLQSERARSPLIIVTQSWRSFNEGSLWRYYKAQSKVFRHYLTRGDAWVNECGWGCRHWCKNQHFQQPSQT